MTNHRISSPTGPSAQEPVSSPRQAPTTSPSEKRPRHSWRRWAKWGLVAGWVLFIWSRSLVPGAASSHESLRVVNLVAPCLEALGLTSLDAQQFVVRKLGHFTEYFVLGALTQLPPAPHTRRQRWIQAIPLCTVPALDETLQLFVPLREGALRDVAIDIAGAACGLLAALLIQRLTSHRRSRKSAR